MVSVIRRAPRILDPAVSSQLPLGLRDYPSHAHAIVVDLKLEVGSKPARKRLAELTPEYGVLGIRGLNCPASAESSRTERDRSDDAHDMFTNV